MKYVSTNYTNYTNESTAFGGITNSTELQKYSECIV